MTLAAHLQHIDVLHRTERQAVDLHAPCRAVPAYEERQFKCLMWAGPVPLAGPNTILQCVMGVAERLLQKVLQTESCCTCSSMLRVLQPS